MVVAEPGEPVGLELDVTEMELPGQHRGRQGPDHRVQPWHPLGDVELEELEPRA